MELTLLAKILEAAFPLHPGSFRFKFVLLSLFLNVLRKLFFKTVRCARAVKKDFAVHTFFLCNYFRSYLCYMQFKELKL